MNKNLERYADIALEAFMLNEEIQVNESAGLEPQSKGPVTVKIEENGDSVSVLISYKLEHFAGCSSDSMYEVIDADKEHTATYSFKDGVMSRDGKEPFEKPWLKESKDKLDVFYKRHSDIIKPLKP